MQDDSSSEPQSVRQKRRKRQVQLLALDMDGTLLNSSSRVDPSSVEALHAALATGVGVCLATGKARPAALAAMRSVGLEGEGLVVSKNGPGLFLQGLAVHGFDGTLLEGQPSLLCNSTPCHPNSMPWSPVQATPKQSIHPHTHGEQGSLLCPV